jgi:hypothetical protein
MRARVAVMFLLTLSSGACVSRPHGSLVAPPASVEFSGTVRSTRGTPVQVAQISATWPGNRIVAYTDSLGDYHLTVPFSRDTLFVYARDGFGPMTAGSGYHFDFAWAIPDQDREIDFLLRYSQPFRGQRSPGHAPGGGRES